MAQRATEEQIQEARAKLLEQVEAALQRLWEHADSVQIVCTLTLPGGKTTIHLSEGIGDWHARVHALESALDDELTEDAEEDDD